jgi:DNA repair protein RadC
MKRAASKATAKSPRWGKAPRSYTGKELCSATELLRELLMEVEGIAGRMEERKIHSLVLRGGFGSESYDRAKSAIKAWVRGLREALHERIENPDAAADEGTA